MRARRAVSALQSRTCNGIAAGLLTHAQVARPGGQVEVTVEGGDARPQAKVVVRLDGVCGWQRIDAISLGLAASAHWRNAQVNRAVHWHHQT